MNRELIDLLMGEFSIFESLLLFALWKCLLEIRKLYAEKLSDRELHCRELLKALGQKQLNEQKQAPALKPPDAACKRDGY